MVLFVSLNEYAYAICLKEVCFSMSWGGMEFFEDKGKRVFGYCDHIWRFLTEYESDAVIGIVK